ncbi:hypothetical protein IJ21_45990 [Paenibacillus sp. 32O-W]|uniref:hypothetical protein n=1 Tax=Paenibacillus sp. 32O-W TaxID=1695218 RepID=UPI0007201DA7|nr:hypothetical protein [Paenibacillus sp. 32O-W]ALS29962.1 hypothetical protein IJ21_45990 [Paenibacillus sp. 32O-W]
MKRSHLGGIIVFVVLIAALYIHNIGYSNVQAMYQLETTGKAIVKMANGLTENHERYLTKEKQPQLLRERMEQKGWTFIQQNGAGYFFEKGGKQIIITAKRWNHFYVVYDLERGLVNLAD